MRHVLKAGYLGEAKSKARLIAGIMQNYFRSIRNMVKLKGLRNIVKDRFNLESGVVIRSEIKQTKINTMLHVIGDRPVKALAVADGGRLAKILELLPPGFGRINTLKAAPDSRDYSTLAVAPQSCRRRGL